MHLRHVLALSVLALAGGALGQDLNLISAVDVRDEGKFVVLSVTGSKAPNFTTFSMADPPRFVIDLSEAKFQGVPEDVPFDDRLIRAVKSLSYGSDSTSIARILVAFTEDVDPPEVLAQGTSLVVRIERPAGVAGMMVAQADAGAQRAREEAEAQARAEAQRRADDEAAAAALADAQRRADEAAAAAAVANAAVDAELRGREERKAQGASDAQAQAQTAVEGQAQAAVDAELKAGDEARQAEARRAQEESERLEALAAAKEEADRQKREEAAEAKRLRAEAIAAAKTEAERKKLEEAERRAEAKRQREEAMAAAKAEAEARKLEAAERRAEAKRQRDEERRALVEARLARTEAGGDALQAGAPAAQLREIGFRQMPGISRVFVRTSVPARFSIQDVGENLIRVELENTRVARRNDARFLDTSFFPSAVALITPSRRGSSYVVDIKLKEKVPYQQRIEGDMLAIDFERPAADTTAAAGR